MRLPCFIFVILLSILSQTECIRNGELVGPNDLDDYKYLVAILARAKPTATTPRPNTEACGGAILNDRLVLTAAHCFAKRTDGNIPDQAFVSVVAHTRSNLDDKVTSGNMVREVTKIYAHAGYFTTRVDHDIAIIQLEESLSLILNFRKVKAVKLPTANFAIAGKEAVLAGYGVHGFENNDVNRPRRDGLLRTMNVKTFEDQPLDRLLFRGRPTDTSVPRGFCSGDSGGSLVIRSRGAVFTDYTVIGLVKSNRADCDDRTDGGVYTRISYYLDSFINKIMANPDNIVDNLIKVKVLCNVQACHN